MSNLTGSVDVVREQERRARLQLLDEIREPSPQPIFGEPVKVELEDETSRRIKNTLGDFTQVLVNDPKSLIGIARGTAAAASATTRPHHHHPSSKHQRPGGGPPNGLHKQPPPVAVVRPSHHPHGKRPHHHAVAKPPQQPPSGSHHHSHSSHPDKVRGDPAIGSRQRPLPPPQSEQQPASSAVTVNINISVSGSSVLSGNIVSTSAALVGGATTSPSSPPHLVNGGAAPPLPVNGLLRSRHHHQPQQQVGRVAQAKHVLPNLVIPEKLEKGADSHIELETILREMKQAVPPPLTAIQTPRTEDSGFAFPTEELPYTKEEEQTVPSEPPPPPPPPDEPDAPKVVPPNNALSQYNLQEDLEMSDSDDEMVPEVKNPPVEYLKSPASGAMDAAPPALSARSSSSDSCDSDSEESSSESNDSDSSASSEASGVGAHSKQSAPQMWGLSNFFDETRRNHSPAFIPMDNNTNSSTAVKEEPIRSVGTERDSFSLVDEDSINLLLGKYSDPHIKEYHRSPMNEMVDMEGAPVAIKTEILSPISSPIRSPPRPIVPIRGPRTPPTPPSPIKEPDDEEEIEELHSQPTFIRSKSPRNSQPLHSQNKSKMRSEGRDDGSKVQSEKSKKQNSRSKNESVNPRVKASPASSNYADDEVFSASKSLPDIPANKEKDAITVVSCPVPSESLQFGREASLKSRHKHSISSSKKVKSHGETSDILEKRSSSSKSHVSKSKHSSAKQQTTQSSSSTRQSSTGKVKGAGGSDDVKKRSKSDCKEKRSESSSKRSSRDASASNNSGHSHKSVSKTSSKSKSKSRSPKRVHESKKSDGKKKRKKFSIKNFLQSPTFSKKESERVSDELPYFSLSPERSPIPDINSDTSESHKRSVSPPQSRSPGRSSSKSTERTTKHSSEKRGHHTPRSERPPSAVPSESSSHYHESGERKSRSGANKNSKSRDRTDRLPISEPPQLLSPIPQHSPIPHFEKSNIVPAKIMVSIPLEKLLRLPGGTTSSDCRFPKGGKSRPDEGAKSRPDEGTNSTQKCSSRDKVSKHDTSDKRSQSKDKIRTETSKSGSRTSKSGSLKKEKSSSKVSSQPSEFSKSKTSSTVNSSKSSIKIVVDTTHCEESESQVSKKRKEEDEGGKQHPKKKLKVSSRPVEEKKIKEHLPIAKKDMTANSTESTGKIKSLERRDSSSGLSSLCSQQSQRSSKTSKEKLKDPHKNAPDAKRSKAVVSPSPLLTAKEIKQEKEDFPKVHIKKEPGLVPSAEKCKLKNREKLPTKDLDNKFKKAHETWNNDTLNTSSQYCQWEEPIKVEDSKAQLDGLNRDSGSDWDHFSSEISIHKELKETSSLIKHSNQTHQHLMPMDYYWTEGKKQKQLAEKEKDPLLQVLKYFEATVLFILTSQQKEEYSKDPDSVYKFYKQTLNFSAVVNSSLQKLQSQYHNTNPGSTEFKLLILCLKCQSLLHVKLYNLKIKEIKEQQKGVSDFFRMHCPTVIHSARNPSHPSPSCQPGGGRLGAVPSPHSPTPSPAGSVNSVGSQSSGYSSSDLHPMMSSRNTLQQTVNVPQSILDMICRQHTHLKELHDGHDLWEQADMYMTRSNLREFFKDVADQSEPLTLHSTIKDLVNYIQKGLSLVKKCIR